MGCGCFYFSAPANYNWPFHCSFPFQRIFKAVKYTRDLSLVEGEDPSARIVHLLATDIPGFGTSDNPVYDEYPGVLSYYYGASLHNLLKGCYNILLRLPPPRNWDGLARFIDHAAQQQELLPKMREFRRFPTHRLSPLHWRAREYMLRSVLTLQGGTSLLRSKFHLRTITFDFRVACLDWQMLYCHNSWRRIGSWGDIFPLRWRRWSRWYGSHDSSWNSFSRIISVRKREWLTWQNYGTTVWIFHSR